MAGIGFELRRVVAAGGDLGRTLQALASGVFVVAGPWLLTVLTIYGVSWFSSLGGGVDSPLLFSAIVTYTYAISLVLFSPVQYFFTRLVSDLVWKEQIREASWYLGWCLLLSSLLVVLVGSALIQGVSLPSVENVEALRWAWIGFAVSVNALWLVMLFISVLKWYARILTVYLVGSVVAAVLMTLLGATEGIAGTVGGLAAGNGFIVLGLLILSYLRYPPKRPEAALQQAYGILLRNGWLVLCGVLYSLGLWVDKFAFWWTRGEPVAGSGLRLFGEYDSVVYLTSLTLIPGLVYFVIVTETQFATRVAEFLNAMTHRPYRTIRRQQYGLAHSARREWKGLAYFQLVVLGGILLATSAISQRWNGELAVASLGTVVQLLLMAGLTFLFYLDLYREAAMVAALFLVAGLFGSSVHLVVASLTPGTGFLLANLVALIGCRTLLFRRLRTIDRILFSRW